MAGIDMPELGEPLQLPCLKAFAVTGIYFLFDGTELVYVGQATDVRARLAQHIADGVKVFDAISALPCTTKELNRREAYYIERFAPRYNRCALAMRVRRERDIGIVSRNRAHHEPRMSLREASEFLGVDAKAILALVSLGHIGAGHRRPRSGNRTWAGSELRQFADRSPDLLQKLVEGRAF